jgi:hypothetical protein
MCFSAGSVTPEMVKFDAAPKESQQMGYLVSIISNMNSESDLVKRHAIVGACQFMMSGRINSSHLLAKVILLWFLPSSSKIALLSSGSQSLKFVFYRQQQLPGEVDRTVFVSIRCRQPKSPAVAVGSSFGSCRIHCQMLSLE